LLLDAGLIRKAQFLNPIGGADEVAVERLTWQRHEFLEAAREEGRWRKAMVIVRQKGGDVTLDVLMQLLTQLMKNTLGLP
jgi:hypothetical protein